MMLKPTQLSGHELIEKLCDLCGFSAPSIQSLTFHILKKHADTNKCSECDYCTSYPQVMNVHKQAKHSSVRYPCTVCDYKGTTEMNLRAHIKYVHTLGPNSFKCDGCSYATTFPGNLKSHKKNKHVKN